MDTNGTGRRNRSWPEALKREIVAASFSQGSSVSKVARHYDVNANQVFGWRKRYGDEARAPAVRSAPQLVPVMVTAEPDAVVTQPAPRHGLGLEEKAAARAGALQEVCLERARGLCLPVVAFAAKT